MVEFEVLNGFVEIESDLDIEYKNMVLTRISDFINGLDVIEEKIYVEQKVGECDYMVLGISKCTNDSDNYNVVIHSMSLHVGMESHERFTSKVSVCAEVNHLIYDPIRYTVW